MSQQEAMDIPGRELAEFYFLGTEAFIEKTVNGGTVVDDGRG
jgi:hypothetical protein